MLHIGTPIEYCQKKKPNKLCTYGMPCNHVVTQYNIWVIIMIMASLHALTVHRKIYNNKFVKQNYLQHLHLVPVIRDHDQQQHMLHTDFQVTGHRWQP